MNKAWFLHMDYSRQSYVRHVLLWLCYYVLLSITMLLTYKGSIYNYAITSILNVFLFAIAYYSLRHIQIPLLYKKGHTFYFVLSMVVSTLVCYTIYWGMRSSILSSYYKLSSDAPYCNPIEYIIRVLRFYSPSLLLLIWEYQHNRKQNVINIRALETQKINNELQFLKAQINPHFLFNTLNNLYSFVITESPKASVMLDRLTNILTYMFNNSQYSRVLLSEELETIEDYLSLEEIRYGDRLEVTYTTSGNKQVDISPLIILSIVENAFKHGASGDIDNPKIKINIDSKDGILVCRVWNTKSRYNGELNDAYKTGIGLTNIKRQLNLIYPNNHDLVIEDGKTEYNVILTINTTE